MKKDGCTSAYILNDKEVYGAGLARNIELAAKDQGLKIAGNEGIDPKAPNFRSQAATIKSSGADCFVFSGITANGAVQLYKDVSAAVPDAKLYGPDGVAESGFADPKEGGIPADVASKVKVSVATLSPDQYPADGQKFFDDFKAKYGEDNPDPYAIYGYEAMKLVLDTCKQLGERLQRSSGDDRRAVRHEGPRVGARYVRHRRERRHHAHRLRDLHDQGRRAGLRRDGQGPGRLIVTP